MTVICVEVTRRKKFTSTIIGELLSFALVLSSVATLWTYNTKYYDVRSRKLYRAWQDPRKSVHQIILPLLVFLLICGSCVRLYIFFKQYRDHNIMAEYVQCSTVEIMPSLGVQLLQSTRRAEKRNSSTPVDAVGNRSHCQFIPRELIFDVIIAEVVSFHRVHSFLYFRVFTSTSCILPTSPPSNCSIMRHMKEGNVKLIPAFPGVNDMTYFECEQKWYSIRAALGCGIYPQPTTNFHHP